MSGIASDLRHAWRSLIHRPLFAAVTVATLALGLGATMAMFTVADAVLLRPLPFPADHQLVVLTERNAVRNISGASFPAVTEWRTFPELASVAAHETQSLLFKEGDAAERLPGVSVSPEFFATLGATPALGRTMQPGDAAIDPARKIVLSDRVWRAHFHGDAQIVGRHIVLEDKQYEVLGVMPPAFAYPADAKFWTSLPPEMSMIRDSRDLRFLEVIARTTSTASIAGVSARLSEWKQRSAAVDPSGAKWIPSAISLRDDTVGSVRKPLLIVFLGVAFLLLVACCNAAALVLAHGRAKLRDLSVQSALGASRSRLVRQLLIEGLLLSIAGSAAALVIALIARDAIVALSANQIPRVDEIRVGWRTVVFALGAGMATTMLVALGPALALTRSSYADRLQSRSRSTTSSAGGRVFGPLIAIECALALMLASAAGLLISSYRHLLAVDTGFRSEHVLTARVAVPLTPQWRGEAVNRRFNDELLTNLKAAPGIAHAALIGRLPLSAVAGGTDVSSADAPADKTAALLQLTSEGYFDAMGSRVLAGRDFTTADSDTAPTVAIVNDVLAQKLWGSASPIGKQLTYQFMRGPVSVEVIGVVPAMRYNDVTAAVRPELYVSFRQSLNTGVSVVVQSTLAPAAAAAAMREVVSRTDPTHSVTMADIAPLDAQRARVLARPRFYLVMVGVFASVALVLAALGIYGTMMFWIGERWREFGIRVALGARSADVTRLLVRHGLTFAGAGIVLGLAMAMTGRTVISSLLFEVSPADPVVLALTIALLIAAAFFAALVPARRVARVDPVITLRAE